MRPRRARRVTGVQHMELRLSTKGDISTGTFLQGFKAEHRHPELGMKKKFSSASALLWSSRVCLNPH